MLFSADNDQASQAEAGFDNLGKISMVESTKEKVVETEGLDIVEAGEEFEYGSDTVTIFVYPNIRHWRETDVESAYIA